MKNKKNSPRYFSVSYYKNHKDERKIKHKIKFNIDSLGIVGISLIIIGIFGVFSRTVVYTPLRLLTSGGGASFARTSVFVFLGILIIALNYRSILGYLLVGIGILLVCGSILISLRMGFMQTSLVKTIFIFSVIIIGSGFLVKSLIRVR